MGAVRRSSCRAITTQLDLYRAITTQLGLHRAMTTQLGLYRAITKQLGLYRAITTPLGLSLDHHTARSVARSPHRSVCRTITTQCKLTLAGVLLHACQELGNQRHFANI